MIGSNFDAHLGKDNCKRQNSGVRTEILERPRPKNAKGWTPAFKSLKSFIWGTPTVLQATKNQRLSEGFVGPFSVRSYSLAIPRNHGFVQRRGSRCPRSL